MFGVVQSNLSLKDLDMSMYGGTFTEVLIKQRPLYIVQFLIKGFWYIYLQGGTF